LLQNQLLETVSSQNANLEIVLSQTRFGLVQQLMCNQTDEQSEQYMECHQLHTHLQESWLQAATNNQQAHHMQL
jgi:hypothetical protein